MNARAHSPPGSAYDPTVDPGSFELSAHNGHEIDPGEIELRLDTPFMDTAVEWQGVARFNDSNAPLPLSPSQRKRLLLRSAGKFVLCLFGSLTALLLVFWLTLPHMEDDDRAALRIPRNFEQLHALTNALEEYANEHYVRVMFAWACVYLFLQAFSVPGSMYMSILASALWGIHVALPLACIVRQLLTGECIRAVPQWDTRVRKWQDAVAEHRHDLLSYLVVIRLTPIPHFVVNLISPHLGVPIGTFWLSALMGAVPQTVIHTALGEKLDEIVTSKDVRIFTLHNLLLIALVLVATTAPALLRRMFHAAPPDAPHGPIHLDEQPSLVDRALTLIYPRWRHRQQTHALDEDAPPLDDSIDAWRDLDWRQRPPADMPPVEETRPYIVDR